MLPSLPFFLAPAVLAFLSSAPRLASAQRALHEQDLVYYGAWVDPDLGYQDSPWKYNQRLGRNASVFQIAQTMPLPPYNYNTGGGGPAPEYLIENTSTNAAVMLTVYPTTLTGLTDDDYQTLGNQVLAYKVNYNRSVFIRWGPEMQGTWNTYGQQPLAYTAAWRAMYQGVKAIAPDAAIVWAPNLGNGYPYGETNVANNTELQALDTNGNGQLDTGDDPYGPYYPGDAYVDWIGLSIYYKQNGQNENDAQQPGFCAAVYTGQATNGGQASQYSWYNTYCTKAGKACMVAESGAAYHPNDDVGPASQLQVQQAWWQDCITNADNFNQFPRIKFHMHFEYAKIENDGGVQDLRDYRLTNVTNLLTQFQGDLNGVANNYIWATYVPIASGVPSSGPGISAPTSAGGASGTKGPTATGPTLVMQTVRDPALTAPPSLFGELLSGSWKVAVPWALSASTSAGLGMWLIGRRSV